MVSSLFRISARTAPAVVTTGNCLKLLHRFLQEADLIMAPITINSQREEAIDFTTQFYAEVVGIGIKTSDNDWFYLFRPLQVEFYFPVRILGRCCESCNFSWLASSHVRMRWAWSAGDICVFPWGGRETQKARFFNAKSTKNEICFPSLLCNTAVCRIYTTIFGFNILHSLDYHSVVQPVLKCDEHSAALSFFRCFSFFIFCFLEPERYRSHMENLLKQMFAPESVSRSSFLVFLSQEELKTGLCGQVLRKQ